MGDPSDDDRLITEAEDLAARLLARAGELRTRADRARARQVASMVADRDSFDFLVTLTDELLRIHDPDTFARRYRQLLDRTGVPTFAGPVDRALLRAGTVAARVAPRVLRDLVGANVRRELASIVLDARPAPVRREVRARRAEGFTLNVNPLGEAVLGDEEADQRHGQAMELLARPEVDYVSVKASAVCANLDVIDFDRSVERIAGRFAELCTAAQASSPPKFVNLDMEELADLWITVRAFLDALSRPDLRGFSAGIALQAYLPDSVAAFDEVAEFARRRVRSGGAPVKVRLVKGANLAMERVDAEVHGWHQAPFSSKTEVDGNYKRLLDRALDPHLDGALRIGVASHNLFDLAWALTLVRHRPDDHGGGSVADRVDIEMLHGMADAEARALVEQTGRVVLYTPVVAPADFGAATAYLVRRFDENTAPENFLTHLPVLEADSAAWADQAARFRSSVRVRHEPPGAPRRHRRPDPPCDRFWNQPDTDTTVAAERRRIAEALRSFRYPDRLTARIDGVEVTDPGDDAGPVAVVDDPNTSRPAYRSVGLGPTAVDRAVAVAREASTRWRATPAPERRRLLHAVADVMERCRPEIVAAMAFDGGKTVREADPEVSEAIDFARYYGDSALDLERPAAAFEPYGVTAVVPPWNFPLAIPAGGVFAALAAGSAVILKPAHETALVGHTLAERCWEAGIPTDVLQYVLTTDHDTGRHLVTHPGVDAVILTGSLATAERFRRWRPDLALHAETSGKNALVVTASADLDDAIRDLVRSAFGHAGQKCSAASLAIVEASVLDGTRFLDRLADAVRSLRVGSGPDPSTQVGPLIRPPEDPLHRALTRLDPGESWLVEPRRLDHARLWSPGVKVGVVPGSHFHRTECFGPVLGVMEVRDVDEAIDVQNDVAFGLTGGISSLDDVEVDHWLDRVEVGNAYVNRHITGAIVQRQPFGGWKASSVGPGIKAGGPFYVGSLGRWTGRTTSAERLDAIERSWSRWRVGVDPSALESEANVLRLRPMRRGVLLRVGAGVPADHLAEAAAVARLVGTPLLVSAAPDVALRPVGDHLHTATPGVDVVREGDRDFVARAPRRDVDRVRLVGRHGPEVLAGLAAARVDTHRVPLAGDPDQELLAWTREQAVSRPLHRHGNPRIPPGWSRSGLADA